MLNAIPVIGWLLSFVFSLSMAVPFWFCWSWLGIGEKYFYFLPEVWWYVPFWDCVWIFVVVSILKFAIVPQLASSSSKVEK